MKKEECIVPDSMLYDYLNRMLLNMGFIFGFKPKEMAFVLNKVKTWDRLITFCIVAKALGTPLVETYKMYKDEEDLMEKCKANVIKLSSHRMKNGSKSA